MSIISCNNGEHVSANTKNQSKGPRTTVEALDQTNASKYLENVIGGSWSTGCINDESEVFSSQTEYQFLEAGLQVVEHQFSDRNCTMPEMDTIVQTDLAPNQKGDVFSADFSQKNVINMFYQIKSAHSLRAMTDSQNCGINDWKLNEIRSVTGSECNKVPARIAHMKWALFPGGSDMQMQVCEKTDTSIANCTALQLSKI